nr:hypothetical protein CFP56_24012 [Quercus suber]
MHAITILSGLCSCGDDVLCTEVDGILNIERHDIILAFAKVPVRTFSCTIGLLVARELCSLHHPQHILISGGVPKRSAAEYAGESLAILQRERHISTLDTNQNIDRCSLHCRGTAGQSMRGCGLKRATAYDLPSCWQVETITDHESDCPYVIHRCSFVAAVKECSAEELDVSLVLAVNRTGRLLTRAIECFAHPDVLRRFATGHIGGRQRLYAIGSICNGRGHVHGSRRRIVRERGSPVGEADSAPVPRVEDDFPKSVSVQSHPMSSQPSRLLAHGGTIGEKPTIPFGGNGGRERGLFELATRCWEVLARREERVRGWRCRRGRQTAHEQRCGAILGGRICSSRPEIDSGRQGPGVKNVEKRSGLILRHPPPESLQLVLPVSSSASQSTPASHRAAPLRFPPPSPSLIQPKREATRLSQHVTLAWLAPPHPASACVLSTASWTCFVVLSFNPWPDRASASDRRPPLRASCSPTEYLLTAPNQPYPPSGIHATERRSVRSIENPPAVDSHHGGRFAKGKRGDGRRSSRLWAWVRRQDEATTERRCCHSFSRFLMRRAVKDRLDGIDRASYLGLIA